MAAPTTSSRILVYTAQSADGLSPEWVCPLNTQFVLNTFNNALLPKDRMMNASLAELKAALLRTLNVRIIRIEALQNKMLETKTEASLAHWNLDTNYLEFTWHGTHPDASKDIAENGARTGNNNVWGTGVNSGTIVEALRYLRIGALVRGMQILMHIFGCMLYTGAHMAVGSQDQMNFGSNANGQPITCLTNNRHPPTIFISRDNSLLVLSSLCMIEWAGYETLTDESVDNLDKSNHHIQTDIDKFKCPFAVAARASKAKAAAAAAAKAAKKAAEEAAAAAKAAKKAAQEEEANAAVNSAAAKTALAAFSATLLGETANPGAAGGGAGGAAAAGLPMYGNVPPTAAAAQQILQAVQQQVAKKRTRRKKEDTWPGHKKRNIPKGNGGAARLPSPHGASAAAVQPPFNFRFQTYNGRVFIKSDQVKVSNWPAVQALYRGFLPTAPAHDIGTIVTMIMDAMQLHLVLTMDDKDASTVIQTANKAAQDNGVFPFFGGQTMDQLLIYAGDTEDILAAVLPFIMIYICTTCGIQVDINADIGDPICSRKVEWDLPDQTNQCCACEADLITAAGGEICTFCKGKGKAAQGGSMAKGGRAAGGAAGAGGAGGAAHGPAWAKAPLPIKDNNTCPTPLCLRVSHDNKPGFHCCMECKNGGPRHTGYCQHFENFRQDSLMAWPAVVLQAVGRVINVPSSPDDDDDDDDPNAAGPSMRRQK